MMMTKKEKKRVPELRFEGFEGEWEEKELRELTSLITKGTTPKEFVDNGVRYVKIESLDGININKSKCLYIDESIHLKELKRSTLKNNDLLFAIAGATIGKVGVVTKDILPANTNQALSIIRLRNVDYLDFLLQVLQSRSMKKYIYQNISVGAQPNLNLEQIGDFKFGFPELTEQQKIASFFTSIDTRIQQLEKKKTLLEEYKKGVMQKIFSQEIRFKTDSGEEFGEWEEKRLGDVAIKKSSNIAANKIEDNFGEYIIYGAPGILKRVDFYEEENDYISIVKDGAGVGRVLYCKGKSSVLGTLDMIKPKKGLDTYFLFCLLENINFTKYVTGSTIPHIYFKDYKKEIIGLPSLEEQTKIAHFLSSLDTKIAVTNEQIEKTKEWKKGLLQRMFV